MLDNAWDGGDNFKMMAPGTNTGTKANPLAWGPEVQIAKLQWSYLAQTLAELAVDLLGPAALFAKGGPDAVDEGKWNRLYVFQRYTSIGAGTTEVQKNIIADRAIKLPRK